MSNMTPAQQTILEAAAGRADGSIHPLPSHIKGGAVNKVSKALRDGGLINDSDCITTLGRQAINADTSPEVTDQVTEATDQVADQVTEGTDQVTEAADEFEEDVTAAEQALAKADSNLSETVWAIARKHLGVMDDDHHLEEVQRLFQALSVAYKEGAASTKTARKTAPPTTRTPRANSKQAQVIAMLRRPEGATIEQITEATEWTGNTVRGVLAGALKKRLGLNVVVINRLRNVGPHAKGGFSTYRIED